MNTIKFMQLVGIVLLAVILFSLTKMLMYHMPPAIDEEVETSEDIKISMELSRASKLEEVPESIERLTHTVERTNEKYELLETRISQEFQNAAKQDHKILKNLNHHLEELLQKLSSLKQHTQDLEKESHQASKQNNAMSELNKSDKSDKSDSITLCDDEARGNKMVISYSLFGKNAEHYGRFISDVSKEALSIDPYRNFTIRIYAGETFSMESRKKFKSLHSNVQFCDVRKIPEYGDISNIIGTVWRFIPIADPTIDVFCSRDLDSPLLQRGGDAVNEWLRSNKLFHVMRDRSVHTTVMMGGLWCSRPSLDIKLGRELLKIILKQARKSASTKADQVILQRYIWTRIKRKCMQHDSFWCGANRGSKPFPTQRRDFFVGCVRDCAVYGKEKCTPACRPKEHPDWIYC